MGDVAPAVESDGLRTAAAAFSFDVAVLGCPTPFNIGGGLGVDFEPEGFEGVLEGVLGVLVVVAELTFDDGDDGDEGCG